MSRTRMQSSAVGRWTTSILITLGIIAAGIGGASVAQAAPAPQIAVVQQAVVAEAAPAAATVVSLAAKKGPVCTYTAGVICGKLYNWGSVGIGIIGSWGQSYSRILQPGQNSTIYFSDTDGFYIGPGYCATLYQLYRGYWASIYSVGSGNHKISDAVQMRIKAYRC